MKKFFTIIATSTLLGLTAPIFAEPSQADLQAEIVQLKDKTANLEKQLQSANAKLVKQIEDDMAMLAKLREENRALKKQLRQIKRDAIAQKAGVATKSATTAKTNVPSAKITTATKSTPSGTPAKAAKAPVSEVKKAESVDSDSRPTKSDSVWDHMFPF